MAVVLITGCSSGFGKLAAFHFARKGDTVFATMRVPSKGADLTAAHERDGLPITVLPLDVTDQSSVDGAVSRILARAGRIDVLVNNAGIGNLAAFEDMYEDELRRIMETNFFGAVRVTRAVLPTMRAQRSGVIVMVSSLSGLAPTPGEMAYCASKFALEAASEALQYEVERFGIRVVIIEPGFFRTGMNERSDITKACPPQSSYRELIDFLNERQRANEAAGEDPQLVAELIYDAAHTTAPQLRYGIGAHAPLVIDGRRQMSEAEWIGAMKSALGFGWWSDGSGRPESSGDV